MLRIEIEVLRSTATLGCSGQIVLGVETETLRHVATSRPEACVVLNLGRVTAIDAAGLGLLVELHCFALQRNQSMKFVNPVGRVRELIALTKLSSILPVTYSADTSPWIDEDSKPGTGRTGRRAMIA